MMTAAAEAPPTRRLHGASMLLLGLAVALVLVDAVALVLTGALTDDPVASVTFTLATVGAVVAGVVLLRDPRHGGLGRLLLGVGAAGALQDLLLAFIEVGLAQFLSGIANVLFVGLLVHLIVRWPDHAVGGRVPRALVAAAYLAPLALTALWQLTWSPRWWEEDLRSRAWITLVPARDFSAAAWQTQQVILVALVGALLALIVFRVVRARGPRRVAMVPVAVTALALAAVDVLGILGAAVPLDLNVVSNLALAAVPVAVLVALVRAPAAIDAPAAPGRRRLDERARDRYQLGLAGIAAGLVVVIAVLVGASSGTRPDAPADPTPGPELVAPER